MIDIEVTGVDTTDALQRMTTALGGAGVSLEGGGVWAGEAHYLVDDGSGAVQVLDAIGVTEVTAREAVIVPLDADVPGALARMLQRLTSAGVRLLAQYSDHDNRKVFVVDDPAAARRALV